MDWWSIFRKIRKAIFIFIALTSLIWAGVLAFYLVREWNHFNILQRTIVISMISVNMVTVIMQYLMIVLPLRVWRDFMRMLFLIVIHTATSVLYTLFGPNFSCKIFPSRSLCEDVDLVFLVCSWAITGLLVGYTAYLCIMSRIPRPIPQITPNLLISANSQSSRRGSVSSIDSATHLLDNDKEPAFVPRSVSTVSQSSTSHTASSQSRMLPQKLYVVNGYPHLDSPDSVTPTGSSVAPYLRSGGSYGAMGTTRSITASPAPTVSSQSTVMTTRGPMVPAATWDHNTAFGQRRATRPDTLQLPNPFMDPVSRPGTADTTYTSLSYDSNASSFGPRGDVYIGRHTLSYNSSTSSFGPRGDVYMGGHEALSYTSRTSSIGPRGDTYMGEHDIVYLSPFQLQDGEKTPRPPVSPNAEAESIYSLYSPDSPTNKDDIDLEKATAATMTVAHAQYLTPPNATVRLTMSGPPRMHTATPHSVHSVAPSVDWTAAEQRSPPPAHVPMNRMPPPVHARAASDPVYRPYTASPRMLRPMQQQHADHDATVLLPNPFPMVGATNVRRYASIGHTRAQLSYPRTGGVRNMHLQAAMGMAPPRTQTYFVPPGKKAVSRAEWRQLVINAAGSR